MSRTGVFITPRTNGDVFIKSNIEGNTDGIEKRFTVIDADGNEAAAVTVPADTAAVKMRVDSPVLWNGIKNPYLYTLKSQLIKDSEVIDEVTERFGFRDTISAQETAFRSTASTLKSRALRATRTEKTSATHSR